MSNPDYRCATDDCDEDLSAAVAAKIAARRRRADPPSLVVERKVDPLPKAASLMARFRRKKQPMYTGPIFLECSKNHWNRFEWPGDGGS